MSTERAAAVEGMRDVAPILLGLVPFGLVAGATAVEAGFPPVLAVAMSAIVFAGASQLAVIELVRTGAAPAVIVLTAVVINLRYLMYSASIAPYLRSFSRRWRPLLTYLLTDQAFALAVTRFEDDGEIAGTYGDATARQWYYFAAAATLWTTWMATTAVGVAVGARVPPGLSLEFAVPLTFLALVFSAVDDRATATAAVVGGVVAVAGVGLPLNLGLIVGASTGIVVGLVVDRLVGVGDGGGGEDEADGDADGGDPA